MQHVGQRYGYVPLDATWRRQVDQTIFEAASNKVAKLVLVSTETYFTESNANVIKLANYSVISRIDNTDAGNDGIIRYNESGLYFMIACAQFCNSINTNASGEAHWWFRLNGTDIPNSNTIPTIHDGKGTVLISQTIAYLEANSSLQLMFSTTAQTLGIVASAPANEPVVPSIVFQRFDCVTRIAWFRMLN